MAIREALDEAMRNRDLTALETALIDYRAMLKKTTSTVSDHAILKEARALGLQLRSEEQVAILSDLKDAIEKNDWPRAETNLEKFKVCWPLCETLYFV